MFSTLVLTTILAVSISILLILGKKTLIALLSNEASYELLLVMIPCIIICAIYTPYKSYLQGRELFFHSSIVELIEQIIRIVACFVIYFLLKDLPVLYAPTIAMGIAALISTILGMYYYKKAGGRFGISKPKLKNLIKKSTPITLVKLLSTVMMPVITIVIPMQMMNSGYSAEETLSLLGIATGMTLPLLSIPGTIIGSLAMAILPQITTMYEEKEHNALSSQISQSMKFTIIVSFIIVPLFMALGEPICEIIFANTQAGTLLQKAAWVMVPMGISQITSTILNSMGKEKNSFIYYIVSGVFLAICIVFLPQYIGIESVIWGLGASSIVVSILNIWKIKKTLGGKYHILPLVIGCSIITLATALLTTYVYNIINSILSITIINIGLSAVVGLTAFILLAFAFGLIDAKIVKDIMHKISRRKNKLKNC